MLKIRMHKKNQVQEAQLRKRKARDLGDSLKSLSMNKREAMTLRMKNQLKIENEN